MASETEQSQSEIQQSKAAVEMDGEVEEYFLSHNNDKSLREEQEKWTQAEEMVEQRRLKAELKRAKKQHQQELVQKQ